MLVHTRKESVKFVNLSVARKVVDIIIVYQVVYITIRNLRSGLFTVVKDIQRALLQADVNVKLVLALTKDLEKRALTERPPAGMSSREHVIRIIYDELVTILGDD